MDGHLPGLAIFSTVLSFSLIGDGLQDAQPEAARALVEPPQCPRFTVTFGSFTAVDQVSFDLHEGQTWRSWASLVRASVTALSIMRLVELYRGKIENGEILFRQPTARSSTLQQREDDMREIRGNAISMIFQEPLTSLNPVYPVGDQVAEAVMSIKDSTRRRPLSGCSRCFGLSGFLSPRAHGAVPP